jgi:hypothetical protein
MPWIPNRGINSRGVLSVHLRAWKQVDTASCAACVPARTAKMGWCRRRSWTPVDGPQEPDLLEAATDDGGQRAAHPMRGSLQVRRSWWCTNWNETTGAVIVVRAVQVRRYAARIRVVSPSSSPRPAPAARDDTGLSGLRRPARYRPSAAARGRWRCGGLI